MPGLKIARDVSGAFASELLLLLLLLTPDIEFAWNSSVVRFARFLVNFVIVQRKIVPAVVNSPTSSSPESRTIKRGSCECGAEKRQRL